MTSTATPAVSFKDVSKAFGDGPQAVHALDAVTFDIPAGSIYGVVGTSGAGKSTLLRTVNGLETITDGVVETLGERPAELSAGHLRRLRREVGMVFQHYNLVGSKTVAENVAMPLVLAKRPSAEIKPRVAEVLELVGLSERAGHRPAQLSGGQRQRVGIARALVTNPKILLCDEPTSALDPITTGQILELLVRINEELGLTILLITHQMNVIARIADSVAVLENGELVENGPVEEVFARPQAPLTRSFIETVIPQALPDSVAETISANPYDALLRVRHSNGAARELISELTSRFDVSASLLHATDAPLRRSTVGSLVLGVNGETSAVRRAVQWASIRDGLEVEELR